MPYKSPIELAESISPKWQPTTFKDVTNAYLSVPNSRVYTFEDGDYRGRARVYDLPNENNLNEGRVSKNLKLWHKGTPVYYQNPEHKEFLDKIIDTVKALYILKK